MKNKFFFIIILIIFVSEFRLYPDVDIFGYFENRFYLINAKTEDTIFNKNGNIGDYNRVRLKFKAVPNEKVSVNIALDIFTFHGIIQSPLGVNTSSDTGDFENSIKIDIDRAYAGIHFKRADLTIGKQRIAIGVSYIWAPLDVFNRVNLIEPKEEKPGVNAAKVFIPIRDRSNLTVVFSPGENFINSKSGLRFHTIISNVDFGLTYIEDGKSGSSIYGVDIRGENFIGWWIESAYVKSAINNSFKLVLGFDYTFPVGTGLYWLSEYYYDSGGERSPEKYNYEILNSGERFTLGRNYLFSMIRYGFSEFINFSISYIGNFDDGSYFISPALSYDLFQNVSLSSGLYIPMGTNGEFGRLRGTLFFLWLKMNF